VTGPANCVIDLNARNSFRRFIKKGDFPIQINSDNTVGNAIYNRQ
jgi:hypothetical protein